METISEIRGNIFKIKRFSIHDGPGIRTSIFLKGCPLNCIWCHSPEGISPDNSIWYDKSLCIGCASCINECPENALSIIRDKDPYIIIDRKLCTTHGNCVNACPTGAIQFTGTSKSASEIMTEIEKDILFYKTSGGGVTLTGGESLYQPDFSLEILKACRKRNIHTAIETCLFCDKKIIDLVMEYADLFIADMKIFSADQHIRYTGQSNEVIKENFRHIAAAGKNILVRIPMIKGITDTKKNIRECENFVHGINKNIIIEHISFNPLAGNNYSRLGIPFLLK
jgi:pyruvate formate lyase activating enzyme